MTKTKDIFNILLFIFTLLIISLFIYLYKIDNTIKNFNTYRNSFDRLIKINTNLSNLLEKRDTLINFDGVVYKVKVFENEVKKLLNSNLKKEFGKEVFLKTEEIQTIFEKKKELIERFKARQATNVNSIHFIYDLNESLFKDERVDNDTKILINNTLFMIMQYFINLNDNREIIEKNLTYLNLKNEKLDENNKKIKIIKEVNFLIIHSRKIIKNIEYLNNLENKSNSLALNKKLEIIHKNLINKFEKEFYFHLLIASFFFFSVLLMIFIIYKEHKKSQKIKNELQSFKYAVENSDNSVVLTDANRKILYVNDIFEKVTGYSKTEVFGANPKFMRSGKTPLSSYEDLNKKLENGEKWEGEFINKRKDGSIFYEKASIVPIYVDKKLTNYLAIKLDVTKYIKQNEKLKLSSIAFNTMQEGILICGEDKRILTTNKAFENITGYKKEEIVGKKPNIFNSGHQDRAFYKHMALEISQKGFWKGKIYDKKKNGDIIPFWLNVATIRDKNGAISKYVAVHTSLEEIISSQRKAEFLAYHDSLTKLPNRMKLENDLNTALDHAKRNNINLFVLFIDLDRFKVINDTLGHSVGDELLIKISQRITSVLRTSDMLARMGGDEFIVVLESCKDKKMAGYVCEKILEIVKEPIEIGNSVLNTSASIGVAMFPDDGFDMSTLVKNADAAMYHAKKLGKNNFQYYDKQLSIDIHEQLQIEQSLKEAIVNKEFYLNYQPQYDLNDKKIIALEALIRWDHPLLGHLPPDRFIPISEDTGDIIEIGKYVFEQACKDFINLKKEYTFLNYISINISSIQFKDKNFVEDIVRIIKRYNMKASQIELEITERYLVDFTKNNMSQIEKLRNLGFRFSIDDFGTGYSSLSYLTNLPIDILKVDKTFIDGIPENNSNVQISKAIIALSKSLGYKVVAEGIEFEEQENYLKTVKCDIGQGFHFSKPLDFDILKELLKKEK